MEIVEVDLAALPAVGEPPFEGPEAFVVASVNDVVVGTCFAPWSPDGAHLARVLEARLHHTTATRAVTRAVGDRAAWATRPAAATEPVSVVVCTIDRLVELRRCLRAVVPQLRPDDELIVVDNSVSGSAAALASAFGARWLHERGPGSGWARNRALTAATHDIVAFVDDDCVADLGWLESIRGPFRDPTVDVVTGGVLARRADLGVPCVIDERYPFHRGWSTRRFEGSTGTALSPHDPWVVGTGASMAWRRRWLEALGGFDPALGSGTPMGAGEELDAFRRTLAHGGTIVYEPGALVWHDHPETLRALRRKLFEYGIGMGALLTKIAFEERDPRARRGAARTAVEEIKWQFRLTGRETARLAIRRPRLPILAVVGQPVAMAIGAARFARHRGRIRSGVPCA